jgi:hypothetical protein
MAKLLSVDSLIEMEEKMVSFGPRLTGSEAHSKMINFMQESMENLGYEIKQDDHIFKRWEPKNYSLKYNCNGESIDVDNKDISYYPYSGITDSDGITAPMEWCGKPVSTFIGSRGKIAVVSMPIFEASCGLVFKKREVYPENFTPPEKQGSPVVSTFVIAPFLDLAKKAGAKAVICIMTGCSDDMARHQYLPFIKTYAGIPALWVTESVGKKIIESAKKKETATLVLEATVTEKAPTRTIYAVLKGQSDKESILINTHTDGSNAFEENAGIGLISLAKYFAEKPIEERQKTLIFSFVAGHFQLHQFGNALNQATTKFLNAHREFWDGKDNHYLATAGVTLEHLGCTEWRDNEDHTEFTKVNDVDPELVYTSNKIMSDLYLSCLEDRKLTRTLMLRPKNMVHFGEGQPIYKKGIPSISLCPGPDYLCNVAPNGYIDKINYDMMYEQIDTFRKVIEKLDNMSRKDLGRKQGFDWGVKF